VCVESGKTVIKRFVTLTMALGGTGAGSGAAFMSPRVSERASKADEVLSDNCTKNRRENQYKRKV